jgi:hypothetical protein
VRTYFIATKHPEYAEYVFPSGSVVIDPWRYIPDQEGVTVARIGENKPALISLLVPSRERPQEFTRMYTSALGTATHARFIEVIAYLDDDDGYARLYPRDGHIQYLTGPRILLSEAWNECYRQAKGEIFMHCGDDLVFKTAGWDTIVREAFTASPDKILLVHGDDVSPNTDLLATHGFLHRRWVEAVGYFLPPLFSCDWNDVWLTEVADMLGRRMKVPIVTEHMHYSFGKAAVDQNTLEREQRGRADNVVELYERTLAERRRDAKKLRKVMAA